MSASLIKQTSGLIQMQQHVQTLIELRTWQATRKQPYMHAVHACQNPGIDSSNPRSFGLCKCANLHDALLDMIETVSVLCRARLNLSQARGWVFECLVGVFNTPSHVHPERLG
jgi:hypothetical protein